MKNAFPGHFANDPHVLEALWEDSLIAVDANVLLSLYRYSDGTKHEFLQVFEQLKGRLWITNQVASEYFKNRLKVIGDQAKSYDGAIKNIGDLRQAFENPKQHPFVSPELLSECVSAFDKVIAELKSSKDAHSEKINDDDVKEVLSQIFEGRVGEPYTKEKMLQIIEDGALRYAEKIPPGFKDAAKGGSGSFEDKIAPYGDYIGWLQLLDKSKADGRNVIFVTGDEKEDWWLRQSGRTIGPLPELVEEFINVTSHKFYMYLPERFLQQAGEFLKQAVSDKAMDEVRQVRIDDGFAFDVDHPKPAFRANLADGFETTLRLLYTLRRAQSGSHDRNETATEVAEEKRFSKINNMQLSVLEQKYQECQAIISEIDSELTNRLIYDPCEKFAHLSDKELEGLIESFNKTRLNLLGEISSALGLDLGGGDS